MEIQFSADQRAFVRLALQAGRLHCEEDAVEEALRMWEERERTRAEILASIDRADESLGHGQGRTITEESMRDLAASVKERGRARLAAEQVASS
jgi:Arc/MetJ-type ribon-helix-helix transcriptional regulator